MPFLLAVTGKLLQDDPVTRVHGQLWNGLQGTQGKAQLEKCIPYKHGAWVWSPELIESQVWHLKSGCLGRQRKGVPRESYVVSYRFTERPCLRKTRWAARLREGDFWGASPKFGVCASHVNPWEPTGTLTETSCFSHYCCCCYRRANTGCLRAWNDPESLDSYLVWLYRFCVTRWFWKCVAPGHMPWKI